MQLSNSLISRLRYQHDTIFELAEGLSETELKQRINPDKWSAFENIVHLVAYQPTFLARIDAILTQDVPVFERYQAENDPHFFECLKKPLTVLSQDSTKDRAVLYNLITEIDPVLLNKKATHKKYGTFRLLK